MNKICETCDTRNRLGLCNGRDGDFKYCFRSAGSVDGVEKTITPFTTIDELYNKCDWLKCARKETLELDSESYCDEHMILLLGVLRWQNAQVGGKIPVGFVTR